ncbi:chondroitin sulfate N-acetylgalactosaminyltransferase 1 [Nothobranchius furzeri]|uniref:Hexosyltransferase n=1 Tax=Nothobranchius furzeri TaxID=105023 RepID=A0A1A8AE58_NOTFU|nr:chondroitin sulfate N-acetylgalactosaminyltransferase 1 [Nothobranchius furzeri]KAF7200549.1 chondroitin sulfate N-acetylgalactosaminyltransferase 1-like [Nothobranchius furzeri]
MLRRWLLYLVARMGLITLGLCCCLLLLYLLACRPASHSKQQPLQWSGGTTSKEGYMALLQEREDSHRHYVNSLTKQISELKEALLERTQQLHESLEQAKSKGILPQGLESLHKNPTESDLKEFFRSQLIQAEVNSGVNLPNEYALTPFDTFTLQTVYQLEGGLSRHPAERPARKDRRDELISAVETALHILNGPQQHRDGAKRKQTYSPADFIQGLTRIERDRGSVYELMFKGDGSRDFRTLVLFRPFGPVMKVKSESVNTHGVVINIIVPLSKRLEAFKQFINNFREAGIQQDGRVHLTVVYFGRDQIEQVKALMDRTTRETRFRSFTLIQVNEEFSRGRGLEVGARAWRHKQNVLLFFCDVDVHFTADFLTSCRLNAEPGKKVYYPVLFSQYNPAIIYSNQTLRPSLQQQLVIRKENGFWRDFGFGMTCQYRSDFINIGGFDRSIKGWGLEDVHVYRKYLHSKMMVIRAPSRGLFHLWHEKSCSDELPADKYKMCMQTKAMSEASHGQLGELFFKQEIEHHLDSQKQKSESI